MKKAINTPLSWSEDQLQMQIFVWFQNTYPKYHGLLFHVPNENESGKRGKKQQFMGQVPGVADLLFFVGGPIAIELKRPDGKGSQSQVQKKWQKQWESAGYGYFVLNDIEEVKDLISGRIKSHEWFEEQLSM